MRLPDEAMQVLSEGLKMQCSDNLNLLSCRAKAGSKSKRYLRPAIIKMGTVGKLLVNEEQ